MSHLKLASDWFGLDQSKVLVFRVVAGIAAWFKYMSKITLFRAKFSSRVTPLPRSQNNIPPWFNNALRKMIESGELKKIKARHHIAEPECDGSRGRSLGFKNVAFAFVLFCGGVAFCMLLLIFEVFGKKYSCFKT